MNFSFEREIILASETVRLQPLLLSDIDLLLPAATSDQDLLQYSPKPVYNYDLLKTYVENALQERLHCTRYTFSVFSVQHQCLAGSTAFMNVSDYDCKIEIGATWIAKTYQGTGINAACKSLLLEYAFDHLGAQRVEFRTDERNQRSRRAIEKIGGKFEGVLRKNMRLYDGFMRSTVYYSILKEEWEALK
jgi:RimJ/RimL family protein N-acetyltransferase